MSRSTWETFRVAWRSRRDLPASDWLLLAQARVLLPVVRLTVRRFGFERTSAILARLGNRGEPTDAVARRDYERADHLADMVLRADPSPEESCLHRALVQQFVLGRRHIGSDLRIGFRREDGKVLGHAWVEVDGKVLADRPDIASVYVSSGDGTGS